MAAVSERQTPGVRSNGQSKVVLANGSMLQSRLSMKKMRLTPERRSTPALGTAARLVVFEQLVEERFQPYGIDVVTFQRKTDRVGGEYRLQRSGVVQKLAGSIDKMHLRIGGKLCIVFERVVGLLNVFVIPVSRLMGRNDLGDEVSVKIKPDQTAEMFG